MTDFGERSPPSKKIWTTLVTNSKYMEGVLTLVYSLQRVGSKYPLVVLYTDTLTASGHHELDSRGIFKRRIKYLLPTEHKDYANDVRFYDCWSKLQPFSLTEFDLVCQLDSDMVVTQNMDELLEVLPLHVERAPFAAAHACVCNPYHKVHYPADWIPENCPYTHYSSGPEHWRGPPCSSGLAMCNGGLQVVIPSQENYDKIVAALDSPNSSNYDFADQSLLSDVFRDLWIPLSYKYNALKTLRNIHKNVWRDEEVKNIHYILTPKPWNEGDDDTNTFPTWRSLNAERLALESTQKV